MNSGKVLDFKLFFDLIKNPHATIEETDFDFSKGMKFALSFLILLLIIKLGFGIAFSAVELKPLIPVLFFTLLYSAVETIIIFNGFIIVGFTSAYIAKNYFHSDYDYSKSIGMASLSAAPIVFFSAINQFVYLFGSIAGTDLLLFYSGISFFTVIFSIIWTFFTLSKAAAKANKIYLENGFISAFIGLFVAAIFNLAIILILSQGYTNLGAALKLI